MSQSGSYLTALVWETSDSEGPTRSEYQTNWNAVDGHKHDNRGAGQGIYAIQTSSVPTQTGDVQITGDTLQWWGSTSSAVISAVTSQSTPTSITFAGPAGVANSRFCGILATSGAPTTGSWRQWDFGYDEGGGIFLCTVAGSPGTWIQIGGPMTGDLKATLRNTSDAGWVLAYGQTVDGTTTTYSNLWTYVNANSLVGSGKPFTGTQSALVLPDLRGQALIGLDNMGGSARNLIAALSALGKTTGTATHTIASTELPITSPWSLSDPGHTHVNHMSDGTQGGNTSGYGPYPQGEFNQFETTGNFVDANYTGITVTNNAGGGNAIPLVQPSYGVNVQIKL